MDGTYTEYLVEVISNLADKFNNGEITHQRYMFLTDKVIEWQELAEERGIR